MSRMGFMACPRRHPKGMSGSKKEPAMELYSVVGKSQPRSIRNGVDRRLFRNVGLFRNGARRSGMTVYTQPQPPGQTCSTKLPHSSAMHRRLLCGFSRGWEPFPRSLVCDSTLPQIQRALIVVMLP
jgi:hypothetical protein